MKSSIMTLDEVPFRRVRSDTPSGAIDKEHLFLASIFNSSKSDFGSLMEILWVLGFRSGKNAGQALPQFTTWVESTVFQ